MLDNLFETEKNILLNHIDKDTMSHAYLFYGAGEDVLDKTILEFLKILYCKNSKYYCDECEECIKINTNNNIDITHIYKDSASIKIKQIRDMQYKISLSSSEYKYNIFVIHNADTMTIESSNAFLKTLEEPVKDTIIILSSPSKEILLPTILSRCIHIKVNDNKVTLSLSDEEKNYIFESLSNILKGNNLNNVNISKKLTKDKNKVENYTLFIMKFFSDVLIYKESNLDMTFNDKSSDYMEYIKQVNNLVTKDKLQKIIDKILYINEMINYNANASLAFLDLFIYIGEDI
ncbi:ATP-binding protein [Anaerofustis stercorihominis]|uniref:DNA polymerase III subunit n=1 Tax=Anaerofustis stercorihominis TaxID=214853 RepID=UPI003983F8C4